MAKAKPSAAANRAASNAKSTAKPKPASKPAPATKKPAPPATKPAPAKKKPAPAKKKPAPPATKKPASATKKPAPAQRPLARPTRRRAPSLAALYEAIAKAAAAKQLDKVAKLTLHAAQRTTSQAQRRELQQVLQRTGNLNLWAQRWTEAAAIYDAGIAVWNEGEDSQITAELLAECGFALLQLHLLDEAEPRIRRSLALHDEAKRAVGGANAVHYLSSVIFERGQIDKAVELAREAVKRSSDAEDARGGTFHAYSLARALYEQGHSREAEEVSKTALEQVKSLGLPAVEGVFENMIANVALDDHRLAEGRQHYERALELFRTAKLETHQAITTSNLGNLAWEEDRLDDALLLYDESIKLQRRGKDARAIAIAVTARAGVLVELGRFAEAQQDLESALATMTQKGHERRVSFVRTAFARLAEARDELVEARAHYAEAEMSLETAGDTVEIGRMLYASAGVEAELGDPETAEALLRRAATLDPASLSPKTGVGEMRAGMHAVRALRELALARIEVARSKRLGGDDAIALRRSATARMQAITNAKHSLMRSSSEVRRVVGRLAAKLEVGIAKPKREPRAGRFRGTAGELAADLTVDFEGGQVIVRGRLQAAGTFAKLDLRGHDTGAAAMVYGSRVVTRAGNANPQATESIRAELELVGAALRGVVYEVHDGGETVRCALDLPRV